MRSSLLAATAALASLFLDVAHALPARIVSTSTVELIVETIYAASASPTLSAAAITTTTTTSASVATVSAIPTGNTTLFPTVHIGCNSTCVNHFLSLTGRSSAAAAMAMAMDAYGSGEWCTSDANVKWCPPTIIHTLDIIGWHMASVAADAEAKSGNCTQDCFVRNMEVVGRRAAAAAMLWAKQFVSNKTWDNASAEADIIDRSIYLLAGEETRNITAAAWQLTSDLASSDSSSDSSSASSSKRSEAAPRSARDQSRRQAQRRARRQARERRGVVATGLSYLTRLPHALWSSVRAALGIDYMITSQQAIDRDPWLADPEVRAGVNSAWHFYSSMTQKNAPLEEKEVGWMRYLVNKWLKSPRVGEKDGLEQYLDFMRDTDLNFHEQETPWEFLKAIRGTRVGAESFYKFRMWQWVEDDDRLHDMDPWEGRNPMQAAEAGADDPLPDILQGYQMEFTVDLMDEADGLYEAGAPVLDAAGNPVLHPVANFERGRILEYENMRTLRMKPGQVIKPGNEPVEWNIFDEDGRILQAADGLPEVVKLNRDTMEATTRYAADVDDPNPAAFRLLPEAVENPWIVPSEWLPEFAPSDVAPHLVESVPSDAGSVADSATAVLWDVTRAVGRVAAEDSEVESIVESIVSTLSEGSEISGVGSSILGLAEAAVGVSAADGVGEELLGGALAIGALALL